MCIGTSNIQVYSFVIVFYYKFRDLWTLTFVYILHFANIRTLLHIMAYGLISDSKYTVHVSMGIIHAYIFHID